MKRAEKAAAVKVKVEMGRGCQRGGGWYRYMEKLADPEAEREARREEARQARERAKWEAEEEAARAERAWERAEQARDRRETHGDGGENARSNAPHNDQASGGGNGSHGGPRVGGRWRRDDLASMRARTWDEYDTAFEAFRERAIRDGTFGVASVPLPPIGHAPIAPAATEAAWHAAVKQAILRWHPDKWARFERMLEETDREALKQLTQAMFRAVQRHKDRGWRNAYYPRTATSTAPRHGDE